MKETKLKQYLYEHPHLLDDAFEVPLTEANKWAKDNKLSAMDVIALAKEKHPDISSEKWAAFEKVAKQSEQKKQEKKGSIVHIRWWQVAVAAIILIVLTFTLVPPARAFAESVIRYIVSIFDGGIDIAKDGDFYSHDTTLNNNPNPPEEEDYELGFIEMTYPDLLSFSSDTGYYPVRVETDDFIIKQIEYQSYEDIFDKLCVTYENRNGVLIYVWQVWGNERGGTIFEDEDDILIQTTTLDGKEVVGYVDNINNECVLEILLEDSNMTILYQGKQDYQIILDSLRYTN